MHHMLSSNEGHSMTAAFIQEPGIHYLSRLLE